MITLAVGGGLGSWVPTCTFYYVVLLGYKYMLIKVSTDNNQPWCTATARFSVP